VFQDCRAIYDGHKKVDTCRSSQTTADVERKYQLEDLVRTLPSSMPVIAAHQITSSISAVKMMLWRDKASWHGEKPKTHAGAAEQPQTRGKS